MHSFEIPLRLALAALVTAGLGLAGCGGATPPTAEAAAAPAAVASTPTDPRLVTPPPALAQRLTLATVGDAPVSEPVQVVARVDFNEQAVARIGSAVTGRVTALHVRPGQAVQAGQALAQLHSAELASAQLALLKARAQQEQAAKAVERARTLLAADVIGSAELQRRENELAVAEVEQRAAADTLRVMGVAPRAKPGPIDSTSAITSTLNGVVVELNVHHGQVVQPAERLFTVADLSTVWVEAQVPEGEIGRVRPGQKVRITVPSAGIDPIEGRLDWVADTVNPQTRTVTVRSQLGNRERLLKPEMLATMTIEPRPVSRLVVPAAAVVREDDTDHVFVREGARYRLTRVQLGDETGGLRAVQGGLKRGDVVVVDGGFHLNNERRRAELGG